MLSVLSLLTAYAGRYDYHDQSSWGGDCPQKGLQQSPIEMAADDGSEDVSIVLKKTGGITQLKQEFNETEHKLYLRWTSEEQNVGHEIISFDYNGVNYTLDHIHSHWGQAEHKITSDDINIGEETDGCYHLVFKGESNLGYWTPFKDDTMYAVIEVRIKFTNAQQIAVDMPRCPNVDSQIPAPCKLSGATNQSVPVDLAKGTTIFDALGWEDNEDHNTMLHYIGSLTTPKCTGPVQWFVRKEITKVYDAANDSAGCDSFASLYPRDTSTCAGSTSYGNFRTHQDKLASFVAYNASFVKPDDGKNCPKPGSSRSFFY